MAKAARKKRGHKTPLIKRRAFLAAFSECGNITEAARVAKIDRTAHYDWLDKYPEYASEFAQAEAKAIDALEGEARRRAMIGVNEPVIHQGQLSGDWVDDEGRPAKQGQDGARFVPLTVKKYSDTLLIFLLKGARPAKYRDNAKVEHSGPGGEPIRVESKVSHAFDHDGYRELFKQVRGVSGNGQRTPAANGN